MNINTQVFPPALAKCGDAIARAVQRKIQTLLEPKFQFFGTIVLKVIIPCIMFHYFSRAGQLIELNVMLAKFIAAVYATGKKNYQHAFLSDPIEKFTMPYKAHRQLYKNNGTTCNLSGLEGSNLLNDECFNPHA